MVKFILNVLIIVCVSIWGNTQTLQELNLDFEQHYKGYPCNWENYGNPNARIYMDSTEVQQGTCSVVIENTENINNFKALGINLPQTYRGNFIRLSGYIKTENVLEGYAGLWMRIDPQLGFDNMFDRGITGTTDWQEYEVILPLNPEKTERIVVDALLVGTGKMWLDNLKVSIDGFELGNENIEIYNKE